MTPADPRAPTPASSALDTGSDDHALAHPRHPAAGRYGLFTTGHGVVFKLGSVLAEDETSVKRKLLTHIGADLEALVGGGVQRLVLLLAR